MALTPFGGFVAPQRALAAAAAAENMAFYGGALQDVAMFIPLHSELAPHRCLHSDRRGALIPCVCIK